MSSTESYAEGKTLLTMAEVGERLRVSDRSVARMIDRGLLEAHRIGERQIRVPASAVDRLLEATRMARVDTRH
jgi:excisionase family DNA binding protein